jgi:hypothetical protein
MRNPRRRLRLAKWLARYVPEGVSASKLVIRIAGGRLWWQSVEPMIVEHMVRCEGVAESDIRRRRYLYDRDAVDVRLWNGRRFEIDNMHVMVSHDHTRRSPRP